MPESFFILSKENLQLARDEIIAIAKTYDKSAKAQHFENVTIIQSIISWKKITQRATFVKISGQILGNLFVDQLLLQNKKTFACKVINVSSKHSDVTKLQSIMGDMISKSTKAKVSLDNPDVIIYLIFVKNHGLFGYATKLGKNPRPTKIQSHPHELDRKLCKAMINLSGLKEGDTVCDPFCGTGTTLLEAEAMGIHSIGIDFDEKMYKISKNNIEANGYKSDIINADFSHLQKISERFDGIVTDLPYGRASKTSDIPQILLEKLVKIIPNRKKLVIMCKKDHQIDTNSMKKYEIYRHKSLTRVILVK